MDLSMDTLHLKYALVLFGTELGSLLTLHLFLLSLKIIMLCQCYPTMTKDHFWIIVYATKLPLRVDVPLNTHSFIPIQYKSLIL